VVDDRLSRAIIEYLAKGRSSFPKTDEAAVVAVAGNDAADMVVRVREIVDEMMAIEIDWSASSLFEGARTARATMGSRHPELSDEALDALHWMFSYSWR
jgi:hypothetical protein